MTPLLDYLTAALVTLLVVVDPPGLGPIFLGVTRGMNKEQQHSVGWRASVIGFGVLAFFAIAGEPFLRLLGITTPAGKQPQVIGMPNALAPGGRLACLQLSGAEPARAAATLTSHGYQVSWKGNVAPNAPTLARAPDGSKVTDAFIDDTNPNHVVLVAMTPADSRYAGSVHLGYPLNQRTDHGITETSC